MKRERVNMEQKNTLGYLLAQTARNIHVRMNDFFSGYGLTLEQWTALKLIKENSPLCQKELARLNHKSPNTIKALVDRLQSKGLIHRQEDPSDRRNLILSLTSEGETLVARISPMEDKANALLESPLTKEETVLMKKLLKKMNS